MAPPMGKTQLAYGNGRSYGDSCLNNDGVLVDMRGLDRFISFDPAAASSTAKAGVLLADILNWRSRRAGSCRSRPAPSTSRVGGAIANDVHGKNHHAAGTFGRHVRELELHRSDGSRLHCSPQENPDWFAGDRRRARPHGTGHSGSIALRRIQGPTWSADTRRFSSYLELSSALGRLGPDYEYTVAWMDCTARGRRAGRGCSCGQPQAGARSAAGSVAAQRWPNCPVRAAAVADQQGTLRAAQHALLSSQAPQATAATPSHYQPFFYPLDGIAYWNRIYGPSGFLQYQCVVPHADARAAIGELLDRSRHADAGSFLAVLKMFGDVPSPGMLVVSAARGRRWRWIFPIAGRRRSACSIGWTSVVRRRAARSIRPRMPECRERFRIYFPEAEKFTRYVDSSFSSSFWRRVTKS